MNRIVNIIAVILIAIAANALEARNLKILNHLHATADVKQINLKGKDIFGKPTQSTEMDLGSIAAAELTRSGDTILIKLMAGSSSWKDVTNEPFTLQFKYPSNRIYKLDIQSGTQDDNKDIVIEVGTSKGATRVQ